MCIKAGDNELETVKNLMSMSLMAVLAESLGAEIDEIPTDARLVEDLNMDHSKELVLRGLIAEYFDGLEVDLTETPTVDTLLDRIVMSEFQGLPA